MKHCLLIFASFCVLFMLHSCVTVEKRINKGNALLELGEYYEASEEYRSAYRMVPASNKKLRGEVSLLMGNCYYKLNSPTRAIGSYRNAIRYGITDSLTNLRLGQMLMMNASYKDAAKEFDSGLEDNAFMMSREDFIQDSLRNAKLRISHRETAQGSDQNFEVDYEEQDSIAKALYPILLEDEEAIRKSGDKKMIKKLEKALKAKDKLIKKAENERAKMIKIAELERQEMAREAAEEEARLKKNAEKEKAQALKDSEEEAKRLKQEAADEKIRLHKEALLEKEDLQKERERIKKAVAEEKAKLQKAENQQKEAEIKEIQTKIDNIEDERAAIMKERSNFSKERQKLLNQRTKKKITKDEYYAEVDALKKHNEELKAKSEELRQQVLKLKAQRQEITSRRSNVDVAAITARYQEEANKAREEKKQLKEEREKLAKERQMEKEEALKAKKAAAKEKALQKVSVRPKRMKNYSHSGDMGLLKYPVPGYPIVESPYQLLPPKDNLMYAYAVSNITTDSVKRYHLNANVEKLMRVGSISAEKAPDWKEQGSEYTVKKESFFNSRRSDFSPMLLGDDSEFIYFTSTRNDATGDEYSGITGIKCGDIFYCQKDDKGQWTKPEPAEGDINTADDEGASCVTPDNGKMYYTQCTTDPDYPRYAQIMSSNRSEATWSKGTKVELTRDTLSSYAHPAVSPDGNWLYFVSDMPGGKGGLDIWRIRIGNGIVGGVENVGEPVNTPGDEMFPTFRPNGDLYFSSNGHPGLGGLDIFIAKIDTAGHWQMEHPGYPLNSAGDDFGMTFEGVYNKGYFSSNRGDGKGWDHIYSFEKDEGLQVLKGWVYEMDGYELPGAIVYLVGNDGTNQRLSVKTDGSFTYVIQPGVDYIMLGTCKGYLNHQEAIRVDSVKKTTEYTLQFPLAFIGAPVLIDNIFFDFAKATLRPESSTSLDKLVTMLNENPNVTIELGAHTDYFGSDVFNDKLSQERAVEVCKYLVEHGIAKDRLTPKGFGERVPKTVSKKMTEKYDWLKEGDVLTEEFIKKLNEDKQQICNQINRRTEFRVLRTTYGLFDKDGKLKNLPKPKPKEDDNEPDDSWF